MARSKAKKKANKANGIALEPTADDQFSLSTHPIVKSEVQELFTFSAYKTEQLPQAAQLAPQPDTTADDGGKDDNNDGEDDDSDDGSNVAKYAPSVLSDPAFPSPGRTLAGYPSDSSDSGEIFYSDLKWPKLKRTIVTPGHPPTIQQPPTDHRTFKVPNSYATADLSLPFENLCRAAIETGNLNAILSATFITDSQTLWALFSTLHDKATNRSYDKRRKGIILVVQVVWDNIFIKAINSDAVDGLTSTAGTIFLQNRYLRWCLKDGDKCVDSFTRVISYQLGDIKIVVEDDNQILLASHECHIDRSRPTTPDEE